MAAKKLIRPDELNFGKIYYLLIIINEKRNVRRIRETTDAKEKNIFFSNFGLYLQKPGALKDPFTFFENIMKWPRCVLYQLHIILKLRNSEIREHSSFFNY